MAGIGGPREANAHAAWRMAVAERAAQAYGRNEKLAARVVAGSVGAGLADSLIESWRARATAYPAKLVAAVVERSLAPGNLSGWAAREALASRGDDFAIHDLLTRTERALLGAVLALNHVYLPHPLIKWQRELISGLDVTPERLAQRLQLMWASGNAKALQEAEALLADVGAAGRGSHGCQSQLIP